MTSDNSKTTTTTPKITPLTDQHEVAKRLQTLRNALYLNYNEVSRKVGTLRQSERAMTLASLENDLAALDYAHAVIMERITAEEPDAGQD